MARKSNPLLIVEDNPDNRELLSIYLLDAGHEVDYAESGAEALEKIQTHKFDLVLLDIMMWGLNGIEVLREIRKRHSMNELPVIMVTARHESEEMVTAFELGANDYVTKPLDPQVLMARVSTHLTIGELFEANREFLGVASHDLKKPLQVTRDVIETIQDDYPPGTTDIDSLDLHERLSIITMAVDYMQRIVNDYLDISTLESETVKFAPTLLDLNTLVKDAIRNNAEYAREKEHDLVMDLQPDLPPVRGNETRLTQVMDNLIGNAIKFSPAGATTRVRTRFDDRGVLFEVRDSGPGLIPDDLKKAFNVKFASLSNRPTGGEKSTGLGLSICKRIIDLHGGDIGVCNNRPPPGATFWFRLSKANLG